MIRIPQISKAIQKKHTGKTVAIVDGKIVAYGNNSVDAEKKAVNKGFDSDCIMTTYIMGRKNYAL
ncbi:hypothetical protein HY463_00780 [Candidatus Peregrinibacteria bacterium]|nr:hypothetical protein [Candidatus Peregrinibacteria bacterium]